MCENNKDFSGIKALILEEKEEALFFFRKRNFSARLEKRLNAKIEKKYLFPLWERRSIPALALALFLVAVIAASVVFVFTSSFQKLDLAAFEEIFLKSPSLQRILKDKTDISEAEVSGSMFELSLKSVHFSVQRKNILYKNIPVFFYRALHDTGIGKKRNKFRFLLNKDSDLLSFDKELRKMRELKDFIYFLSKIVNLEKS